MQDLFLSKKEQLLIYFRAKKWLRTSQVIAWGLDNYCNRAERTARELADEGHIRRMDKSKKNFYFNTKEDVWEYIYG